MFNLPNLFLFYRILAVPAFIVAFAQGWHLASIIIFATAAISDFFDGYFARKQNLVNDFGKLMDPLADKILTAAAFIVLTVAGVIPAWAVIVIIFREYLVTGLRGLAASSNKIIAARFSGKLKTFLQMFAIVAYLAIPLFATEIAALQIAANILFYAAVAATIYSGLEYCWDCRQVFVDSFKPAKKSRG